jgi:hypothetical protein
MYMQFLPIIISARDKIFDIYILSSDKGDCFLQVGLLHLSLSYFSGRLNRQKRRYVHVLQPGSNLVGSLVDLIIRFR